MAATRLLPRWGEFGEALIVAAQRFPLCLVCGVAFALVFVVNDTPEVFSRVPLFSFIGFFAFLAIRLTAEARGWTWPLEWFLHATAAALIAAHVYGLTYGGAPALSSDSETAFAIAFVLTACVAPFVGRGGTDPAFWAFNRASWTSAAFGLVFAVILAVGLIAVFALRDALFDTQVRSDLFVDIWVVAMAVIWPWIALSGVPRRHPSPAPLHVPRPVALLVTYGLVPLVVVCMALLSVYLLRVAVLWSLPDGGLAWMICGYAGLGIAVHVLAYPLRDHGAPWVRAFHRHFYRSLLPLTALLALAAGVRVAAYGLTEPRYFLLLLTVWMAALSVVFSTLPRASVRLAPAALAGLLALGSVGPWGAFATSVASQQRQLEALLIDSGLLADGRLVPLGGTVPPGRARRIADIARYLERRDGLAELAAWAGGEGGLTAGRLLAAANLYDKEANRTAMRRYKPRPLTTVSVRDFDIYRKIELPREQYWIRTIIDPETGTKYHLEIDRERPKLSVRGPDQATVVFDLEQIVLSLPERGSLERAKSIWRASENGLRVALQIDNLAADVGAGFTELRSLDAVVLIGRDSPTVPNEGGRSP